MDLANLDTNDLANRGGIMTVTHPKTDEVVLDDNKQPVTITLLGADSRKLKARERELTNNRLRKGFRTKPPTAEKMIEDDIQTLAIATVGWSGVKLDGQLVDCNADNAAQLYARLDWLRDQVSEFVNDRGNFLKA